MTTQIQRQKANDDDWRVGGGEGRDMQGKEGCFFGGKRENCRKEKCVDAERGKL
jgi:hypothetical protein